MTSAEVALSEFVYGLRPTDVPEATLERVRLHLIDAIACGLAGVTAEHRPEVERAADSLFGPGTATVLGRTPRAAGGAMLLNSFQIAALVR